MARQRSPLRRLTRIIELLVLAAVLLTAVGIWWTGGEYPAETTRHTKAVTAPGPFQPPAGAPPQSPARRTVVMMVFDGLAPAMLEGQATPALDRLRREGAWSNNMVPPFPSISLTGGFTISTGCWPEHHGIVTNRFFDPQRGFYDHSRDADWASGCEHLHQVAERQGVPSAALGWYGAVSATRGKLARDVAYEATWKEYPTDTARAQQVVDLLARPATERPQLILAYFRGPDSAAHFKGMDSPEVRAAVAETDRAVGTVLAALERIGNAALIVTTDHGMRPTAELINVEYLLRRHGIAARMVATGTTAFIYLDDPATRPQAIEALTPYDSFDIIRPEAPPAWAHLGSGPRVGDLILSAKPPYVIEDRGQLPWYVRWLAWVGPETVDARSSLHASHGYPPDTPGVQGAFFAWGDGVQRGKQLERVDAIDIHPTVTQLLGIAPGVPVDGQPIVALLSPNEP
ncbi:MAG: alkaline phosphatase family protein [Deltaproteobacteria bacterium]|nr:alkaline phosphatase family protein [Deltaproteobacteria bacterium]